MKGAILKCKLGVRYWEDSSVNGIEDEFGKLIPCRQGDYWFIEIDVTNGRINNWEDGNTAKIHYKVCDDGQYTLIDKYDKIILSNDSYVPDTLSPKENGFGDYVIMDIDEDGFIQGWSYDEGELIEYLSE